MGISLAIFHAGPTPDSSHSAGRRPSVFGPPKQVQIEAPNSIPSDTS